MVTKILLAVIAAAGIFSIARAIKNIYVVKKSQKELDKALEEYHEALKFKDDAMMTGRDAINLLIASMNESAMKGWRE